eukprot:7359043-Prorocentrum_lima.AAC.1
MSELMAIVHAELRGDSPPQHCVAHTSFQEIYFADDTICFSSDGDSLEDLLTKIEEVSARFGMELNKTKCELLRLGTAMSTLHFGDGTPVPVVHEAKYLGCFLNDHTNARQELRQRTSACMTILKKLD